MEPNLQTNINVIFYTKKVIKKQNAVFVKHQFRAKTKGTTGMEKNLMLHHKKFYAEFDEAKKKTNKRKISSETMRNQIAKNPPKQTKISDYKPIEKWKKNNPMSKKIDDLMFRYICLFAYPMSHFHKQKNLDFLIFLKLDVQGKI